MPPSLVASPFPHVTGARPSVKLGSTLLGISENQFLLLSTSVTGLSEVFLLKLDENSEPLWTKPEISGAGAALYNQRAVLFDRKYLVVYGGSTAKGEQPISAYCKILDLTTWKWLNARNTAGVAAFPREGHGMVSLAPNKFYVFGGVSMGRELVDGWILEISCDFGDFQMTWTEGLSFPQPMPRMTYCACGSEIFAFSQNRLLSIQSTEVLGKKGTWKLAPQNGHIPNISEKGWNSLSCISEEELGMFIHENERIDLRVYDRKFHFWSKLQISGLPRSLPETVWGWSGLRESVGIFLHGNEVIVLSDRKFVAAVKVAENTASSEDLHKALFMTRKLVAAKEEYLVEMGASLFLAKQRVATAEEEISDLKTKLHSAEELCRSLQRQLDTVVHNDQKISDHIATLNSLVKVLADRNKLADDVVENVRKFLLNDNDASEKLKRSLIIYKDALYHEQSPLSLVQEKRLRNSLDKNSVSRVSAKRTQ